MTTETYSIAQGQFLAQLEPFKSKGLPTNSIIHKMVTGCGATTLELEFPRNSIIIEPNLPVILGKCRKINGNTRKHKIVQGVYEDVEIEHIQNYIKNKKGFKKIMTTPEGFEKILEAIGESVYKDYFLLFDECEKAIQDVDFRTAIINPMDAFFKFDNKAFVSATPLIPSDPRFKDFTHVTIQPDYDFSEAITVYTTNNIIYQLKVILDKYEISEADKDRKIFIFFKSTKRIRNIIKGLKLTDYAVYCSEKSVKELRRTEIENAYDSINDKFAKYNFLTSRFYSAVDIDYKDYKCDPIIIMVSDVIAVEHSVIDPSTEAIQICGRFRKPEKVEGESEIIVTKDIFHIANYNTKLTSFNESEIEAILEDKRRLHQFISTFKPNSDIEYINEFIKEILKMNGFGYFIHENGDFNYFMIDNFVFTEKVKRSYKTSKALLEKYQTVAHFSVNQSSKYVHHSLTDQQLLSIKDSSAYTTINEEVSKWVKEIMTSDSENPWSSLGISMIRYNYPEQIHLYEQYGIENAPALDYNLNKIQQQLEDSKGLKRLLPIIKYIQRTFKIGKGYTSSEIDALLTIGITETGLSDLKPDVRLLRNGVQLSERTSIKKNELGEWIKGYEVLEYLHSF